MKLLLVLGIMMIIAFIVKHAVLAKVYGELSKDDKKLRAFIEPLDKCEFVEENRDMIWNSSSKRLFYIAKNVF